MSVWVHELPLCLAMALLGVFIVCQGFEPEDFSGFCSEQMVFESSVLGWHKKVFGLSYTLAISLHQN